MPATFSPFASSARLHRLGLIFFSLTCSIGLVCILFSAPVCAQSASATVNDTDSGFTYSGSGWFYSSNRGLGDYQNDVHATTNNGDSVSYTFTGGGISYVAETNTDEGNVQVYLDGTLQTTVNCNSATRQVQQTLWSKSGLASGSHTLKLVKQDGQVMLLDAVQVTPAQSAVTTVNDTNSGITYTGTWYYSSGRGLGDYQDDVHAATNNGAAASYTFTGTSVSYVTETASDEGNVQVFLDGVLQTTVNCNTATRQVQQLVWGTSGLSLGTHTLKIVKQSGSYMLLDAVQVTPIPTTGGIIYGAPNSQPASDIPPPGWAEDVMPMDDSSDADGMGPSLGGPVNTASGVEENSPGADLWAYNPLGPSASYSRMYRSTRATQGYHSPGLSPGWVDNYDQSITITGSTYTRVYPNGGQEAWGGTTGTLTPPSGAPYTAVQTPSANSKPAFITVTEKDRSREIFTQIPTAAGAYPAGTYLLSQVTNLVGHSIFLNRDASGSAYRLLSITNDAATPLALLSFSYAPSGLLASVTDSISSANPSGIRQVAYTFAAGNLSAVSQITAPGASSPPTRWGYGYTPNPANGQPLLTQVQAPNPANPGSLASTYTDYYSTGAVAEHIDATGRVKTYAYNGSQTQIQADNADGSLAQSWTQKQNTGSKNQDAGVVDAKNKSTAIAYGSTYSPYLPTAETNRNGQTASVAYFDSYGNLATVTSPRNVVTTFTYGNPTDFALNQVASVQESILNGTSAGDTKQPTTFTYYGTGDGVLNGLLKTVSSPQPDSTTASPGAPVTTTYSYDSLGNVTQMTTPNANGTMTVAYNYTADGSFTQAEAVGEPLTVTVSGPDAYGGTTTATTHYRYDGRGNRIAVIDPSGYETDFAYNLADQPTDTLYPATNDSGTGRTKTSIAYQYVGGPDSATTVYDESGNLFRQVGNVYDAEGEVLTVQGNTYPVQYAYDGRGRVKSVTYYGQSVMNASTTYYDYDAVGNLTDIRYPGQTGANFDELQYTYDADSNVIKEIDGIGLEKDYQRFDPATKVADPESLLRTIHYVYPAGYAGKKIGDVAFAYDHYGRRASITSLDPANQSPYITQKTYAYDDLDDLTSQTTNFGYDSSGNQQGLLGPTLTFRHNPDGSRNMLGSTEGDYQTYYYDGLGRLTLTYLPVSSFGASYSYQTNGWMTRRQAFYYPGSGQLQPYLQTDQTYNPRGFVTTLTNSMLANATLGSTAQMLSSFTGTNPAATGAPRMTYDPDGNRLQELVTLPAFTTAPDLGRAVSYQYDGFDELVQETSQATGGTTGLNYTNMFGYDLSGNPTTSNRLIGSGFNTDNQNTTILLSNNSSGSISYNGNGDPSKLSIEYGSSSATGLTAALYDPEDRLLSSDDGSVRMTYDGDGLRTFDNIGSQGEPSYHLFDGSTSVVEAGNNSYAQLAFNLYGADGLAGRVTNGDGYLAELYDPQGNAVQTVHFHSSGNTNPQVAKTVAYDAFGERGAFSNDTSANLTTFTYNPVGFGGQFSYYKEPYGHYLLGHRFYDPGTGRFVTRDPIGYNGGINLYGFTGNNPVNESDPSGYLPSNTRYYPDSGIDNPYLRTLFAQPAVQHFIKGVQQAGSVLDGIINRNFGPSVDVYPAGQVPSCGCSSGFPVHFFPHDTPQGMSMMAGKGGGKLPGGLNNASPGLKELFSQGSLKGGRSIIGIRQTLIKNGFKMQKARGYGYLFKNNIGEQVRIMSRKGGWDVRVQNRGGGQLDEIGNQTQGQAAAHGFDVYSK